MCNIYSVKNKKPPFKQDIIVYVQHPETPNIKVPKFAKLWNLVIDENGENYTWKERDSNARIEFPIDYWSDYPVFDISKVCEKETNN